MRFKGLVLFGFLVVLACGKGGETREWSTGKAADGTRPDQTGGAVAPPATNGANGANGTPASPAGVNGVGTNPPATGSADTVGGDDGTVTPTATLLPLSKTLEQCEQSGKAWIAVVNSGKDPAVCGDPLTDWCCTEPEIYARFPTMEGLIKQRIEQNKTDKYTLYHCSVDATGKYTFHMGQIGDNFIKYKTIFVSSVIATDTGHNGRTGCTAVKTADLKVAGTETGGAVTGQTNLKFADIQPILKANCEGAQCHSTTSNLSQAMQFVDAEPRVKALSTTKLENKTHDPVLTGVSDDSITRIVAFIKQP